MPSSKPGGRSAAAGPTTSSTPRRSTPTPFPIIGYPKAWTNGTNGLVSGDAVMADIQNDEDYAKYQGKLRGKFVLTRRCAMSLPPLRPHRRTATPTTSSPGARVATPMRMAAAAAAARAPAARGRRAARLRPAGGSDPSSGGRSSSSMRACSR